MKTVKHGALEYEIAENIPAAHAFTGRPGGISGGCFASLNLTLHRGDREENVRKNYGILASALDFDPEKLVLSHQIHSDIVRAVDERDCLGIDHHAYPECDGLITNTPGVSLCIFTADCTPVLLCDPVTGAVGAVHAGWRGTAADIAGKAVRAMASAYGCDPKNIRAAIGPNIGFCCFQTDDDVPRAIRESYGPAAEKFICRRGEKYYVDLKAINALSLSRAGVQSIDLSGSCTLCSPERYYSHRRLGPRRGSQGAIICRR